MDVTFAHLCDYASISREGKLSVMGIFSQINAAAVPLVHPQAYLAFELEANYAEVGKPFTIDIEIVDEDGAGAVRVHADGVIQTPAPAKPGEKPRIFQFLTFNNLKLNKFGTYNINLFINQRLARQLEFRTAPVGQ